MAEIISFIGTLIKVAIFLACVLGVIAFRGYNKLRELSENVKEAWSNVGVTARKQVSLINQLIDTVKGYADNEKLVMLKVSNDLSVANLSQVHQESGMVVSAINGMAQRFPDLKANEQYNLLMHNIREIENQLEAQRANYNAATKEYNVRRNSIPHVFYSKLLGFNPAPYLDLHSSDPQSMEELRTISSDDGSRLNEILGTAGSKVMAIGRDLGTKAIEQSKVAVDAAQVKIKQLRTQEYTYLDQDKNPQGPVSFDGLLELRNSGGISDDTSVMQIGAKEWKKFGEIEQAAKAAEPQI